MARCRGIYAIGICLVVFVGLQQILPLYASREDTEEDLLPRIQREHNLVKRAKYEIRLAHVKLLHGSDACQKDDHEACAKLMSAFLDLMRSSWKDLQSSGRDAVKQPSGFRELDIALREDNLALEDLKRRLPIEDRNALDPVIQEAERIHNDVFSALFPSGNPRPKGNKHVSQGESHFVAMKVAFSQDQKGDVLTADEQDELREAQEPSVRIQLYIKFLQSRLDRFEAFRSKPLDPKYDNGSYMDGLLAQFISVNDELKNWIDDQYDRNGDMRRGLHALLDSGQKQLETLRRIALAPDSYAPDYAASLRDAIADLTDTLDGGTKALNGQEKKFGAIKREEKEEAQASKERAKEEKKRAKEEEKLRKKEHKSGVPGDSDQN